MTFTVRVTRSNHYYVLKELKDAVDDFINDGNALPSTPIITLPSGVDIDLSSITLPTDLSWTYLKITIRGVTVNVTLPNVTLDMDGGFNQKLLKVPGSNAWDYSRNGFDNKPGTFYSPDEYYWMPRDGFKDGQIIIMAVAIVIALDYAGFDVISKYFVKRFFTKNRFNQARQLVRMEQKLDTATTKVDDVQSTVDDVTTKVGSSASGKSLGQLFDDLIVQIDSGDTSRDEIIELLTNLITNIGVKLIMM
jgi:hypothetical protein